MTVEKRIASAFGLDDDGWARHANPWSGRSRVSTTMPLLVAAIWSRAWIGYWSTDTHRSRRHTRDMANPVGNDPHYRRQALVHRPDGDPLRRHGRHSAGTSLSPTGWIGS